MEITKEMQAIFNENFDANAYEAAKNSVESIISMPQSLELIMKLTSGYDKDNTFDEEFDDQESWKPSFRCEVELDRSHMETDADFVSVEFVLEYDESTHKGKIAQTTLFVDGALQGFCGAICQFDPDTYEFIEWLY